MLISLMTGVSLSFCRKQYCSNNPVFSLLLTISSVVNRVSSTKPVPCKIFTNCSTLPLKLSNKRSFTVKFGTNEGRSRLEKREVENRLPSGFFVKNKKHR